MKIKVFETPEFKPFFFRESKEVYERMKDYKKADREMFMVIFLTAKNQVIDMEVSGIGTVDGTAVYPREIFRSALLKQASSLICVHNHPSGDPDPSQNDREITKELVAGGKLLQIKILDHMIIGRDGYFSFADEGIIGDYEAELERAKGGNHGRF